MKTKTRDMEAVSKLSRRLRLQRRRKLNIFEDAPSSGQPCKTKLTKRQGVETPDGMIDEVIAARILGLTPRTLANRRSQRLPPEFVRRGRRVFYRRSHIEELAQIPHSQW